LTFGAGVGSELAELPVRDSHQVLHARRAVTPMQQQAGRNNSGDFYELSSSGTATYDFQTVCSGETVLYGASAERISRQNENIARLRMDDECWHHAVRRAMSANCFFMSVAPRFTSSFDAVKGYALPCTACHPSTHRKHKWLASLSLRKRTTLSLPN
jgi:hypothetical protein